MTIFPESSTVHDDKSFLTRLAINAEDLSRNSERLLTRTGLDWTDRYEATAKAISALAIQTA
jgi:hypothetical protein